MHILLFTSLYPTERQPASGTFVVEQVRALTQMHRVTVVRPQSGRVREQLQPCRPEADETWTVYRPLFVAFPRISFLWYLAASLRWSRRFDWSTVDIVHAHVATPSGFTAALLSRMHHKPFVLTEHAGDFAGWIAPYSRRLLVHWTIKQADCVMPVSHALQRNIERAGMAGTFTVVPNIINTRMFHPTAAPRDEENPAFHLLWLGGYVKNYWVRKGGPELLHAIALARPHIPQGVRLTLIVDGPARVVSEVLAQRLGILDICTFPGMMKNIEVRDWMQRCDAVIMTSRSESFGVVLIEAMGCGKPVIATRCGGPQEVVTPETGILVPPRDVQAMADAVVQMSQTYQTYDVHQIAAYVTNTFGPQAVARRLNQVYAGVCASYRARSGRPVLP